VFPDSFLPNLVLFVAGQAAAWFYLRTGRLWLGSVPMAVMWIAADVAVVLRFVFADTGPLYGWSLGVLQGTALATAAALLVARWRRRWSGTARQRAVLFGAAMQHYLAGRHEQAVVGFRRLARCDPWDAASWLALGNALRRLARAAAARGCYRRCLRVDGNGEYTDLARAMTAALAPARHAPGAGPAASPSPPPPSPCPERP
jgi:tetratricopeptide (TPR) repeat protein